MKAGFARAEITPPVGTTMMGFGGRDNDHGCEGVHDDLFARALSVIHEGEEALIMTFDLCFLGREEADRLKGAIGRRIDLSPRRILLNTSHTHVGPAVGTWAEHGYRAPDRLYLAELEQATLQAALQAREGRQDVTLHCGETRTRVPVSRRKPDGRGGVGWAPYEDGVVYDYLPVCLMKAASGAPVCLMFSVSCHPSTSHAFLISADYPGAAMAGLDEYLGTTGSMFLQGTGGDAKARVIARADHWASGTWEEIEQEGRGLAREVIDCIEAGLEPVEPAICCQSVEAEWPLESPPDRAWFESAITEPGCTELRRLWAQRQLALIERRGGLPKTATITTHGVQLGAGLRLIGLEGEAVGGLGHLIRRAYGTGWVFPMGYTDGAQLYLPTESMLAEGGYEVDSYYEYGYPAPFARGFEQVLADSLETLKCAGVK